MLRKVVFWFHLVAGVIAGAVILMMSVTGVVLTYERQLIERAESRLAVSVPEHAEPRSVDNLLDRAKTHGALIHGDFEPTSLVLKNDPAAAVPVSAGRAGKVYLDPYTGELLSTGFPRLEGFLSSVRGWHRWFNLSGESRKAGRAVTGAANLAFLAIVLTGLFLWIPKRWTWRRLRAVLFFKRGLGGKARDFNWHNTIGFWAAAPLLLIVASGVVISYRWAGDVVRLMTGVPSTAEQAPPVCEGQPGPAGAVACAEQQVAEWRSMTLSLPGEAGAPARVRALDESTVPWMRTTPASSGSKTSFFLVSVL